MSNNAKVKSVRFEYPKTIFDGKAKAILEMDDGSSDELDFYHDEIQFTEAELVGKTMDECRTLRHEKDVAWLKS